MRLRTANSTNTSIWIALTLVCGLAITAFATWRQAGLNNAEVASALRSATEQIAADVVERISLYEYGVRGARGAVIVAGPEQVSHELFVRYSRSRNVDVEFPDARGFGFIRRVPVEEEAAFIAAMRRDGRP